MHMINYIRNTTGKGLQRTLGQQRTIGDVENVFKTRAGNNSQNT